MICEAAKLYHQLQTIEDGQVPILIPTFNLVSYAKFMVSQLKDRGLNNFIICDNNSTYPAMTEYLNEISKNERVVRLDQNLGPRVFAERQEFLSVLPEYFVITDPDLIFNENLPKNFITKMKRILDTYNVAKAGFAIDIEETKDKFFNAGQVRIWEGHYWSNHINLYPERDDIFFAPIDTTFCLYKKSALVQELKKVNHEITLVPSVRIAGRFTCQHMGWWREQPIPQEEMDFYNQTQLWASTQNEKKRLGYA